MKKFLQLLLFALSGVMGLFMGHAQAKDSDKTAYDFSFTTLIGQKPMPLAQYKGKVLLIVNTASRCGFTPQYKGLQTLYDKYKDQGLVVIGVPSNDFGGQEPGTAEEIKNFCDVHYGVTFPMASKQDVIGDNAHPFYKWAGDVLGFAAAPKWNFHKYLVDRSGKLADYFGSATKPDSDKLTEAIETQLKKR